MSILVIGNIKQLFWNYVWVCLFLLLLFDACVIKTLDFRFPQFSNFEKKSSSYM